MIYQFAERIFGSRWLMGATDMRRLIVAAEEATMEAVESRLAAIQQRAAAPQMMGDVAVINISGPITYRETMFSAFFGGATVERMQAQFRTALADPAVKGIVFRVDSPGGTVDAVPTFAAEIARARGQKPMVTISDTLNASAALWISSQADRLLVEPTSMTGSIGVLMAHQDVSKLAEDMGVKVTFIYAGEHKVDGHPFAPLPDDVRARWQAEVDAVRGDFVAAVATGRKTTQRNVREKYGEGLVYSAKDAVKFGLADGFATFEEALAMAPAPKGYRSRRTAAGLATLGEIAGTSTIELGAIALEAASTTTDDAPVAEPEAVAEIIDPVAEPITADAEVVVETPAVDLAAQIAADRDYADAGIRIAERL